VTSRITKWWGVIALAAMAVLAAGIGQSSHGHTILAKAGLAEVPASYTSLAFLQPQSLPNQLTSERESVDVSFVITNTSSTPRDYQWSVSLITEQRAAVTAKGNVSVAAGQKADVIRLAAISCRRGRVHIVISLAHPAEGIDAWSACLPEKVKPKK
jgi:hypothetical protein